jgi:hypothetical protein
MIKFEDKKKYDQRHGGPFDRGSADSWYRRGTNPHFYEGPTHFSDRVPESEMTTKEIQAYLAGFFWNEQFGGHKDYS